MTAAVPPAPANRAPTVFQGLLRRVPSWVLFGAVASFWGMNTVTMRITGRYVPPLSVAAVRSVVGGLLLLAFARLQGADRPRSREEWKGCLSIGLFMTGLSTAFLFLGAKNAPAGVIAILSNTMPLFVAGFGVVLLSVSVSTRAVVGLLVGLAGTVVIAWRATQGEVSWLGVLFGTLAAVTSAIGSLMYQRYPMPRLDRLMVVAVQLLFSAVVLGVMAVPEDRGSLRFPPQFVASFLYLAVAGLAVSFVCWSELLRRGSALLASAVAYLATVLGVLFGAVLLGERLGWSVLVGGAIAIVGVAIVQSGPRPVPSSSPHSRSADARTEG